MNKFEITDMVENIEIEEAEKLYKNNLRKVIEAFNETKDLPEHHGFNLLEALNSEYYDTHKNDNYYNVQNPYGLLVLLLGAELHIEDGLFFNDYWYKRLDNNDFPIDTLRDLTERFVFENFGYMGFYRRRDIFTTVKLTAALVDRLDDKYTFFEEVSKENPMAFASIFRGDIGGNIRIYMSQRFFDKYKEMIFFDKAYTLYEEGNLLFSAVEEYIPENEQTRDSDDFLYISYNYNIHTAENLLKNNPHLKVLEGFVKELKLAETLKKGKIKKFNNDLLKKLRMRILRQEDNS